jgi:uncharacterized membrane protein YcaP (DUF421 family)
VPVTPFSLFSVGMAVLTLVLAVLLPRIRIGISAAWWPSWCSSCSSGAGAALVAMHWALAASAFQMSWFGPVVKGEPVLLIEDGQVREDGMRKASLSENDLAEALRLQSKDTDPKKIRLAYLERDGSISVVPREEEPRILNVSVEEGVQTIRIKLEG